MAESFISLRVSKDGGYTWSDWNARSLGETGDFSKPVIWRRLGNSDRVTFQFRADGAPTIVNAYVLDASGNWVEAPIGSGAYADNARLWTYQDTVNYVPVRVERPGATAQWILRGAPGYRLFANVGDGPIRAAADVEGKLLVVSGEEVYRVNRDTTTDLLGTLPGEGRATITHNQEGGGNKVVFGNGTRGYTYDTITGVYAQITDEAFPGFLVCDYLDQYILGIEPQRRFAFHSDLADAREYSTIDVFEAEGAPDRLMGQAVIGGQWWLFGERTTEIFANTGAATGTFQRIPGATIDRGLAGTHAVAKLDNALWILGDDGIVYRSNGYSFIRVSTHAIEQALRTCDLTQVFFQTFEDAGHKILYVTAPDGRTWGFDVATQEWARRESFGLNRWRMNVLVKWAGVWLVGDYQHGKMYQLDWALRDEAGDPLIGGRTTGSLVNQGNRFTMSGIKLDIDTGRGLEPLTGITAIIDPLVIYSPMGQVYVDTPVSHQYLSAGGVRPHVFTIVDGSLPAGLSMDTDGLVTGTPTTAAEYAWRVRVTDAVGSTADLDEGQDAGLGIEGPDEFLVGYRPPSLMTDVRAYNGARSAMTLETSDVGWDANMNFVKVSPDGLYCVASRRASVLGTFFELRKFNPDTKGWDVLANPADMPAEGPLDAAWHPDGTYLAICGTDINGPSSDLIVYRRDGDVFTKIADPVENATSNINGVCWDSAGQRLGFGLAVSTSPAGLWDFSESTETLYNLRECPAVVGAAGGERVAFLPGTGSRYLAWASATAANRMGVLEVDTDLCRSAVVVNEDASAGIHWDASGSYLIAVGATSPNYVSVWQFQGSTINTETLIHESDAADQPASTPYWSDISADRLYLAVSRNSSQIPTLYSIDQPLPPTANKLADVAAAGADIRGVSWTNFDI